MSVSLSSLPFPCPVRLLGSSPCSLFIGDDGSRDFFLGFHVLEGEGKCISFIEGSSSALLRQTEFLSPELNDLRLVVGLGLNSSVGDGMDTNIEVVDVGEDFDEFLVISSASKKVVEVDRERRKCGWRVIEIVKDKHPSAPEFCPVANESTNSAGALWRGFFA